MYRRSPSAGSKMTSAAGESKFSGPPAQGSVAGVVCHPAGRSIEIPWMADVKVASPGRGDCSGDGVGSEVGLGLATGPPRPC